METLLLVVMEHSVAARGMATEKQVMMRINATKNISKITQSMKMVSAAKLRGDQARLAQAQPFNVSYCYYWVIIVICWQNLPYPVRCTAIAKVSRRFLLNAITWYVSMRLLL